MEPIRHYLISGRVQGVGYRAFARAGAHATRVRGWVRNLADGRVEALAQGPREALERFEADLRRGPPHGRVDDVTARDWTEARESLPEFELRKDAAEPCSAP